MQSADDMVKDAVNGDGTAPSASEMENEAKDATEQAGDAAKSEADKMMETAPEVPGK